MAAPPPNVKSPSPLLGFNNNVRHKGRVFHIQTEDSGVRHPHIITHLFADGGRILKTIKTSYADHVTEASMTETVRALMQEQHKAMFIALRGGTYDHLFEDAAAPKAPPLATPAEVDASEPHPGSIEPRTRKPSRPELKLDPAALLAPPPSRDQRGATATYAEPAALQPEIPAGARASDRPALVVREIHDLPPPPAAVFARRLGESQRPYRKGDTEPPRSNSASGSRGRYAPSRPAAIFTTHLADMGEGASIFGDELISEKSLDEVILSYLAEDLDGPASR